MSSGVTIRNWTLRYPVRNGSVVNVLSLPTIIAPQVGSAPTTSGNAVSERDVHSTFVSVCNATPSCEDSTGSDSTAASQETPRSTTQRECKLANSAPIYYQTIMGQLSSDVDVGEPSLGSSPLVIDPNGLPVMRQTKVAPSKVTTNYFQTKGFAPLPHPPPIHTNPDHRPQPSDVFMHSVLDDGGRYGPSDMGPLGQRWSTFVGYRPLPPQHRSPWPTGSGP